ncbi:MAG: DUF3288 family protein [Aquiluna sp.]
MNDQFAQRSRDYNILTILAEVQQPAACEKVQLAALLMRYQGDGFVGEIDKVLSRWGLSRKELFSQSREIWLNGYRPEHLYGEGSAWDAKPGE